MNEINKDELLNLKKEMEAEPEIIEKDAKIIYDKRQYSVRIPAKIAKTMNLEPKTDKIKFTVTIPSKFNEKPELKIELIKNASE
ncbi:MAG: hypothetical protein KAI53_00650 [Candidatus Aenigmarchaeota archaeon]|nr:hypothetical protein [Candidatus Aenigmarchaeota archaeon]